MVFHDLQKSLVPGLPGLAHGSIPSKKARFVLWGYGKNPIRVDLMPAAFENLEPGGVMYVDEMQSAEIHDAFDRLGGRGEGETVVDGFGRYGAFIRKS